MSSWLRAAGSGDVAIQVKRKWVEKWIASSPLKWLLAMTVGVLRFLASRQVGGLCFLTNRRQC
jgi:hypothetical protein